MSDTTDTTQTTTTQTVEAPKKQRGRKKISEGGKPSPKKVYCVCSADGSSPEEIHCVNSNKDTTDEQVHAEAKALYTEKHGAEPTTVLGPYFQRMGGASPSKRNTAVVKGLSMETAEFVPSKRGTAVYKEWNVIVRFLSNNEEAVFISYKNHTKEEKKTKPSNKFVLLEALENLQLAAEEQA